MAGSITVATTEVANNILRYAVTWTSDASGDVSGTAFEMMVGTLIAVEFVPGAGALQPSDLYDVDMVDAQGATMFDDGAGTTIGANLSNAIAQNKVPLVGLTGVTIYRRWHHGGTVEPRVSSAGASKSGRIDIYITGGVL